MPLIDMTKLANFSYKHLTRSPGNMLLITGTLGWILSSIAQLTAVSANKKIPKEQKKFLIPQEIADAAVNIAAFYIITRSFTKLGERLVNGGKLTNPAIKAFLEKTKLNLKTGTKEFYNEIEKKTGNTISVERPFSILKQKEFEQNVDKIQDKFYNFSDAMSFVFGTVGAIVSSNIVTPYGRNAIATVFQKHNGQKPVLNPATPVMPMFTTRTSFDDFKQKTTTKPTINPVFTSTGGALKI